ncbi:TolB family protein [Roseibium marinum]|uniref:WD40 repeat protein n=1 Tax=Roseibium marinum TaxID=281252 RepID=A0A2S3UQS0_9HYPH|nr:TolB family protein [Roseibium marinum]POF30026.1 WD40 repeat protein [Roseibium marinum]
MKSFICTFDIETGAETVVLVTERHLEAPNWTPDGSELIVNGDGRLYRLALAEPGLAEIDTGFANKINNDHGLSPDGSKLVISDSSQTRESCIYILPSTGGTPKKVTGKVPSYWHGYAPDGRTIAYTARRAETYQIFTCPAEGGEEFQVTSDFDHCDGPDYSPDGKWIWFNGERDGSVQLWRVHPDGSGLEAMTGDARVNWFPHPSPDGQKVVYLAYEGGTKGHPGGKTVELRLMPGNGGPAQILCSLHGGQGTINVPSWAPDSQRFAFVRYES